MSIVLANGASGSKVLDSEDGDYKKFHDSLNYVAVKLAN